MRKDQVPDFVAQLNLAALQHYARLLQACGVARIRVYDSMLVPGA